MNQVEDKLNEVFTKNVSVKLPQAGKEILVKAMPWLAIIGGVLSLFGVWSLYRLINVVNNWSRVANDLGQTYGNPVEQNLGAFIWVAITVLIVEGVMLIAAFSPLKSHKKLGWNLVYWVSLINLVYTIVYAFVDFGFFSLLFALIASAVGLYLLFQVRSYYLGGSAASKHVK